MTKEFHIRFQHFLCVAFLMLFLSSFTLFAKNPNLIFRHLEVEDGLSQSTVHVSYQDKNGFMWFGTDIGLNKYDGYEFTVYQFNAQDTTSISSNFIVEINEDSYGGLWIGNGYNGLDLFDREKEIFLRYSHDTNNPGSISNNNIRAIFEDSRKNLWIGTSGGGLNLYNRQKNTFSHIIHDSLNANSLGSNFISSIAEDKDGNLWIGSTEGILCKFNPEKNTFLNFPFYSNYKGDLFNTTFGSVYIDSDNDVWFGTEIGLFVYDQQEKKFTHYEKKNSGNCLNANAVSSILELEKGLFLIATDHGGLNVLDKKTGLFTYYMNKRYDETSISNDQLYSIYRSPDDIIWIGSFHGGVNIYDRKAVKFQQYKYLLSGQDDLNCCSSVLSICEDPDNNIWIGNDGQGIDIFNPTIHSVKQLLPEPNNLNSIRSHVITDIYLDKNKDIWIGTYLEGMSKFDWKTKQYTHYTHKVNENNSLGGNNIWTITEDRNNLLWLGTIGNGLDAFDRKKNLFTHFRNDPENPNSLSNNDVFIVFEDNRQNLWIGTRNGLNLKINGNNNFKRYISDPKDTGSLFGTWIYDIFQDSRGNLWIGTDIGLNLYLSGSENFIHYSEKDGLSGNAILGILEDKNKNLWLSTNKGLSKFDPVRKLFRNYDVADGLQGSEFNYTSKLFSSTGKIYFGGKNGFNVFDPDSIQDNTTQPEVFLTNFKVFNETVSPRSKNKILSKHINFSKEITLSYKQSVISIEFAALNYTNSRKNQYAYKLEGFDKEWNYIGSRREVTYTNLNPGKYTFRTKACNNDGVWNQKGTSLEIIITPPIWRTPWAYGIELFLILSSIYLYIVYREKRLKSDKKILQEKVSERTLKIEQQKEELEQHRNHLEKLIESRTEELIAAKEKAEESDMLKSAFLANMSHEIRTPMNAIVGFSNLLEDRDITTEERNEFISLINSNSESLLILIEDILDLSLIEANQVLIRPEVFEVNELLENIHSSFAVNNKKFDLEITLNNKLKSSHIKLNTDKFRTKQILSNLMNNAYKFTEKGIVELGVYLKGDKLIFYVKDTGIGISEEDRGFIFDRFRKLEQQKISHYRGAGLGLAISKRLAELLGGELWVESEIGAGSTFNFSFPFSIVKSTDENIPKSASLSVGYNWINRNILVVEDEKTNFIYLQKVLLKTNANVHWAENGLKAVDKFAQANEFDIVLMDIKMPFMNGYEAAKIIKTKFPDLIIIAQTAHARPEDEYNLRNAGFNDYLSKPIKPDTLYRVINKYFLS
jgi:signal transduction histidine kinase/ligand-binding sensor domain-containing protein/CheY-like chemotaxis protein